MLRARSVSSAASLVDASAGGLRDWPFACPRWPRVGRGRPRLAAAGVSFAHIRSRCVCLPLFLRCACGARMQWVFTYMNSTSGVNDACIAVRAPCACTRKWWCRLAAGWQLGASPNAARSSLGRAAHCREPGVHVQGNPGNEWKCIFAEHTSPFIKTPIFPLQVCRVLIRGVLANQGGEQPIDSSVAGVSRAATRALGPPPLASLRFA